MNSLPVEIHAQIIDRLVNTEDMDDTTSIKQRNSIVALSMINKSFRGMFRDEIFWSNLCLFQEQYMFDISCFIDHIKDCYTACAAISSFIPVFLQRNVRRNGPFDDYALFWVLGEENWNRVFRMYDMKKDGLPSTITIYSSIYKKYKKTLETLSRGPFECVKGKTPSLSDFLKHMMRYIKVDNPRHQENILTDYAKLIRAENISNGDGCVEAVYFIANSCCTLNKYKRLRDLFIGCLKNKEDKEKITRKMDHISKDDGIGHLHYFNCNFNHMVHKTPSGRYFNDR